MREETTHKRISYRNVERVEKIGNFGESFDDVITRVLDAWEEEGDDGAEYRPGWCPLEDV